jgi:peptide/nickel transport system substrate-binding protein
MKRFALASLAACSLLIGLANAATRPHYGGTLRVAMRAAPASLDPMELAAGDTLQGRNLTALIFDTLIVLDDHGQPQPRLATSWTEDSGGQRWIFSLCANVQFQDGTPLTADQVAASLRAANPNWKVQASGSSVEIERDSHADNLLAELALPRNAIAKRSLSRALGTGPFAVEQWDPGRKLSLSANNDYWNGRPFLDSIEISFGQDLSRQLLTLESSKLDLIELSAEQAQRAANGERNAVTSAPSELMALVFAREAASDADADLRKALAWSIDRKALSDVLLQGAATPAGGILPEWMTGYEYLFPSQPDLTAARLARAEWKQPTAWTLAYDLGDPLQRLVAERIVLNARDLSIAIQLTDGNNADLRLQRIPLASLDAQLALQMAAQSLHLSMPQVTGQSSQDLYGTENALLRSRRVIPLLHLRLSRGMSKNLRNWSESPNGDWHLENVWLSADQ